MNKTGAGDDRQEQTPRPRRRTWIFLVLVLLGAQGLYYYVQDADSPRESESLRAMVKRMGAHYVQADRDFAAGMEAHYRDSPLSGFGPERAADAAARSAMSAWVAKAIGMIDEALMRRERILHETIAEIEHASVNEKQKIPILAEIRNAAAQSVPMSVRMMNAMRAYLKKTGEIMAHLDLNAAGLSLRDGQLAFEDGAAADRFNVLEDERIALEQELKRLQQQVQKPRP